MAGGAAVSAVAEPAGGAATGNVARGAGRGGGSDDAGGGAVDEHGLPAGDSRPAAQRDRARKSETGQP